MVAKMPAFEDPKTQLVARTLRTRIVGGDFSPGMRLPTWTEMESAFGVGRTTLTRALGQLKRDGFIFASSTRGMFVSERPPHLYRYGLVFPMMPDELGWNRFWSALAARAMPVARRMDVEIALFYGIRPEADRSVKAKLLSQADSQRFAGLIVVGASELLLEELRDASLPKVAVTSNRLSSLEVPHIYPDRASFLARAVEALRGSGRSRVAVLSEHRDPFAQAGDELRRAGLTTRSQWLLQASAIHPASATAIVELLLDRPADQRPDALLITDDNLVDMALAGIVRAGVRVPDDLVVVAHCNWPTDRASVLPTLRLGFDADDLLERCVGMVRALRRGDDVPEMTPLPALFEHELASLVAH